MSRPPSLALYSVTLLLTLALVLATTPLGRADSDGSRTLYAPEVATAPTLDGSGDELVWAEAEPLTASNGVTLKALRSGGKLFLLVTWADTTSDHDPEGWTYHEDDLEWERGAEHNEDMLALMWNIDNSITNFNTQGPLVLCKGGTMRTGGDNEVGDLWMWHAGNTNYAGYLHDRHLTNDEAEEHDEGRGGGHGEEGQEHPDSPHAPSFKDDSSDHGGFTTNQQVLNFTDDPDNSTHVPRYWKPDPGSGVFAWHIIEADIDSGAAKQIVEVYTNGTLIDEDNTTVATDARIPGFIQEVPEGSGGDIAGAGQHSGGQWTLEISRPLTTSTPAEDIQFDESTGVYYFGVSKFDNTHGSGHLPSLEAYALTFAEPKAELWGAAKVGGAIAVGAAALLGASILLRGRTQKMDE